MAKYNWLYFLHSDCIPPKNFKEIIYKSMIDKNQASCFKLRFKPTNFFCHYQQEQPNTIISFVEEVINPYLFIKICFFCVEDSTKITRCAKILIL